MDLFMARDRAKRCDRIMGNSDDGVLFVRFLTNIDKLQIRKWTGRNGTARSVWCHTLTQYIRDVRASAIAFRSVSESSGGPLPSITALHQSPSIRYPITSQALMILLGLQVSISGDDHYTLVVARLSFENSMKNPLQARVRSGSRPRGALRRSTSASAVLRASTEMLQLLAKPTGRAGRILQGRKIKTSVSRAGSKLCLVFFYVSAERRAVRSRFWPRRVAKAP
ncbi:hypothetical protein EVAR_27942_1 [Eumeta japonica]|uniref:Uncharacterized protein n=1 Tax=Eumeta variegata TaxID=151549 RepID=A0A4C1UV61_EUMVA|nr:hypothetical protein EVAR_27942_1 [Eumeta japonica]